MGGDVNGPAGYIVTGPEGIIETDTCETLDDALGLAGYALREHGGE